LSASFETLLGALWFCRVGDEVFVRHHSAGWSLDGAGMNKYSNDWGAIDLNLLIVFDMLSGSII
jgi:hypothetical protein